MLITSPARDDVRSAAGGRSRDVYKLQRPDIIEAILRGDDPDGLSLEKLRKNLPVRWDEQIRA